MSKKCKIQISSTDSESSNESRSESSSEDNSSSESSGESSSEDNSSSESESSSAVSYIESSDSIDADTGSSDNNTTKRKIDNKISKSKDSKNKQHMCYIIKSIDTPHVYIGYTVDFNRRLRQHNRKIKGGAKHTSKYYPYKPVCVIMGFPDQYTAHSFEWHLQHVPNIPTQSPKTTKSSYSKKSTTYRRPTRVRRQRPFKRVIPRLKNVLDNLERVINSKGGSKTKDTVMQWPHLKLNWFIDHKIKHKRITNNHNS